MPKIKHIHNAAASASSHLTPSGNTEILQQHPTAAIMASLVTSNDSIKLSDLNGMQNHLLWILDHTKHKTQARSMLSLQTRMSHAERSVNLKQISQQSI